MQHFIGYPTNSRYLCGADAIGRRNTATDTDPKLTTCRACKADPYFKKVEAEAAAVENSQFSQTDGRFAYTPEAAENTPQQ